MARLERMLTEKWFNNKTIGRARKITTPKRQDMN